MKPVGDKEWAPWFLNSWIPSSSWGSSVNVPLVSVRNFCVLITFPLSFPFFLPSLSLSPPFFFWILWKFNWFQFISARISNPNKFVSSLAVEVTDDNTPCSDNSRKAENLESSDTERAPACCQIVWRVWDQNYLRLISLPLQPWICRDTKAPMKTSLPDRKHPYIKNPPPNRNNGIGNNLYYNEARPLKWEIGIFGGIGNSLVPQRVSLCNISGLPKAMHLWGTNSFSKSPLSVNTHMNFILQFCGKIVSQYAYVFLTLYPMAIRQSMLMSRWHTHGKTVPEQIQMTLFQTPGFSVNRKAALAEHEGQWEMGSSRVGREIIENFMFFSPATEISLLLAKMSQSWTHGC